MRDRLLFAASALARLVLVVVAFGLAVGSIGLSAARGFCPEVDTQALAMSAVATIVDAPTDEEPAPGDVGTDEAPTEEAPTDEAPADEAPAQDGGDTGGECPGGVQRCLPPLFSSILILGEPACHDQAGGRLRGTLVPAFVGSTVLLAGAWWLRPTRLHADRGAGVEDHADGEQLRSD